MSNDMLKIDTDETGNWPVVRVEGEIDAATCETLASVLGEVLERSPAGLELEFTQVSFVDSSGLRTLVQAHQRLGERGPLRVSGATPNFRRLLEITGLDQLFAVS